MNKPLRIGHRGAAGHVLENTLDSIEKAIELRVDYVEIDLRLTRDGHVVVLHDATIDRTTNGHGRIKDLTLAQLKRIKTKDGQHVPTLEEVLKVTDGRVGLMLELKIRGRAKAVTEIVEQSGFSSPVIYASFHHKELARVRQCLSSAKIMPLISHGQIAHGIPAKLSADHVGIRFDRVVKEVVESLHAAGVRVFVFTVNGADDIARMRDIGADGIISDMPADFRMNGTDMTWEMEDGMRQV
ncbi:MAG TPA: glycerophosphodiester phosphodiesterase family protein [Nitrospiraceae bacterium]|nr:glycerophosphodiester phosphodiesterase family protein [Nitrospiraceae bacterium]